MHTRINKTCSFVKSKDIKILKGFIDDSSPRSESEKSFLNFNLLSLHKTVYKSENTITVHSLRL